MPITSRPARATGMVCAWMGVGVSYFSSASARTRGAARPKSWNEGAEAAGAAAGAVGGEAAAADVPAADAPASGGVVSEVGRTKVNLTIFLVVRQGLLKPRARVCA